MPEHVHLLVWPVNPSLGNVAGFLKTLKLSSSTRIKHHLMRNESTLLEQLRVRERAGKYVFRFWQEGPGFDRNVTSAEQAENVIDYIHRNPLRRELCERPEDWIWSSYRHYLQDDRYPPVEAPKWRPLTAQYLQGN